MTTHRTATGYDADEHGWFGGLGRLGRPLHARGAGRRARRAHRRLAGRDGRPGVRRRVRRDPARVRRRARARSTRPSGSRDKVGARILLKREDLNHTGAHKIRNVLGQALLTKRMGKTRVIAETGAGQHGVASATAAAYFGLDCTVYMGAVDTRRQALNVARMQLLGAKVVPVDSGSATLKDAINEALRDWVASVDHTAYLFGTAAGPHPFPSMVRDFTRGIGDEARAAVPRPAPAGCRTRSRPASAAAPTRSGCSPRSSTTRTSRSTASRPAATASTPPRHAATIHAGDARRAARRPHLRAPGRGRPDHRVALDLGRPRLPGRRPAARPPRRRPAGRRTSPVTDAEAMDAMALLSRTEGIIPAIESAHALAGALRVAERLAAETGPRRPCWSTSPAAATRTWAPRSSGSGSATRRYRAGTSQCSEHRRVAFEKARADGRAALVGYLPAGFPDVAGGIDGAAAPWSTPAATSSRSACPTATR